MPSDATFDSFEKELNRLVESFGKRLAELKQPGYAEAQLRDDFLNPLFRALGWDMENRAGLIQKEREVEIESATQIGGGRKRADYLFRTDKRERFVCEAKKPAEELHSRYAFQAKRYAWNKGVPVAVLTDFEELKIYIVGGKPYIEEPQVGEWKFWNFRQYPLIARELWDLLARDKVAGGSIDRPFWKRCRSNPPARAKPVSNGSSSPIAPARLTPTFSNFLMKPGANWHRIFIKTTSTPNCWTETGSPKPASGSLIASSFSASVKTGTLIPANACNPLWTSGARTPGMTTLDAARISIPWICATLLPPITE